MSMAAFYGGSLDHIKAVDAVGYLPEPTSFLENAADFCDLDVLKWALAQERFQDYVDWPAIAGKAARSEKEPKEKLEWVLENGGHLPPCACTSAVCVAAISTVSTPNPSYMSLGYSSNLYSVHHGTFAMYSMAFDARPELPLHPCPSGS